MWISIAPRFCRTSITVHLAYKCMSTSTTSSYQKTKFWKKQASSIQMARLEPISIRWTICERPYLSGDSSIGLNHCYNGSWANLNDPDHPTPLAEPGLTALAQEIRSTVDQEAQIIQAVFPMKEDVMRVFLQRVFAQVVSLKADFGLPGSTLSPSESISAIDPAASRKSLCKSGDTWHLSAPAHASINA
jgi:hypothetical protein